MSNLRNFFFDSVIDEIDLNGKHFEVGVFFLFDFCKCEYIYCPVRETEQKEKKTREENIY